MLTHFGRRWRRTADRRSCVLINPKVRWRDFRFPMSSDASTKIDVWLTIGFGAGLYLFYEGFKTFREYKVLADTPEIPIRSVAMGFVQVHGQATGVPPVMSPVTKSPCFFYKVDIEN